PAYHSITGDLKLAFSQFEELETFARFGSRLDENTRKIIEHGKRIRACLKQKELNPMSVEAQILILLALKEGLFDEIPLEKMNAAQEELLKTAKDLPGELVKRLNSSEELQEKDRQILLDEANKVLSPMKPSKTENQDKEHANT
ncbi:MAG: F0F1 ATP synthase subunit alpha, partial [Cyclobacteriaceae bacterium]